MRMWLEKRRTHLCRGGGGQRLCGGGGGGSHSVAGRGCAIDSALQSSRCAQEIGGKLSAGKQRDSQAWERRPQPAGVSSAKRTYARGCHPCCGRQAQTPSRPLLQSEKVVRRGRGFSLRYGVSFLMGRGRRVSGKQKTENKTNQRSVPRLPGGGARQQPC